MTRSADRTTANLENATTFYLTNVVPQQADLNQGVWAQFEDFVGDSAEKGRAVYIITGPLYSKTHGLTFLKNEGKVAVPDSTWKIAIIGPRIGGVPFKLTDVQTWDDLAGLTVLAVNMPNVAGVRNDPWQKYLTTIDKIETATGYDFLSLLQTSYQDAVEAGDRPPVASYSVTGTPNEGSSLKFDASASTDPDLGRADLGRTEALTYRWHFSDGGQTSGKVAYHVFHDNGPFTATLTVADAFGWEKNSMQTVTVANVTPTVTFAATTPTSIFSGDAVGVSGSFADPGSDAAWHSLIDWGNGTTTPATLNVSGAAITGSSTFLALGSFTVTLSVTDKDGAKGVANSLTVNVARRPVPTSIESPTINLNGNGNGNVALTLTAGNGVDVSLVDVSSIRLGTVGVTPKGLAGLLHERRHTYEISEFGGLAAPMPVYAASYLFIVLASVGLPLLNGFVGEFLVLNGAFQAKPIYGILAATGVIWSAIYLLWMFQRVFYGKVTHPENTSLPDLSGFEKAAIWPCAAAALAMGVAPILWLAAIDPAVQAALTAVPQVISKVVGQ